MGDVLLLVVEVGAFEHLFPHVRVGAVTPYQEVSRHGHSLPCISAVEKRWNELGEGCVDGEEEGEG